MIKQSSLSRRIFWWMAFVGLVPLLVMAVQGYYYVVRGIKEAEKAHLITVLDSRSSCVKRIFEGLKEDFSTAGSSNCIKGACEGHDSPLGLEAPLCHMLEALRTRENYYTAIATYNTNWQIITAANSSISNLLLSSSFKKCLQQDNDLVVYDDLIYTKDSVFVQVGQSFVDKNGHFMAYIVAILDLSQAASRLVNDDSGLGETGKIYLLSRKGRYIAPPKDSSGLVGKKSDIPDRLASEPGSSVMRYRDWRGVPVLGVSARSPQVDMLVVAEIDESEVFELLRHLILSAVIIGLFTLVIVFFISSKSSKRLSFPLCELARVAKAISTGNHKERVPYFSDKEIQEVGDAFNQMLDRLGASQRALVHTASLAAVGELSSSIAHEMKSPLSSIKINLQALGKKVSGDKTYLEMADISLQQLHRLEIMLTDLLNYSKPLHLKPESISFGILSQDVIHTIGPAVEQRGLTLEVEDYIGDVKLHIDRELMVRALTSLVDNAVQWSPPGGIISLSGEKLSETESCFALQVTDEGPGIQDIHRKRLFQPFFTTRPQGTGLGLANVEKIVGRHGGIVFAKNNLMRGAVFTVHLPFTGLEA